MLRVREWLRIRWSRVRRYLRIRRWPHIRWLRVRRRLGNQVGARWLGHGYRNAGAWSGDRRALHFAGHSTSYISRAGLPPNAWATALSRCSSTSLACVLADSTSESRLSHPLTFCMNTGSPCTDAQRLYDYAHRQEFWGLAAAPARRGGNCTDSGGHTPTISPPTISSGPNPNVPSVDRSEPDVLPSAMR